MVEVEVRIERLDPMRVAGVHGFGDSPEPQAYAKLLAWAGPAGLLEDQKKHRIFGFNNPSPSPGSPNYGYELWIRVGSDVESDGEPEIKEFTGGLYAVSRVTGIRHIGPAWSRLSTWCENSKYKCAGHQWLEEHIGPVTPTQSDDEVVLDLFHPIAE